VCCILLWHVLCSLPSKNILVPPPVVIIGALVLTTTPEYHVIQREKHLVFPADLSVLSYMSVLSHAQFVLIHSLLVEVVHFLQVFLVKYL
jgi:hypothetical protein